MKRLVFLVILLAAIGYVLWPALSLYQLKNALDAADTATIESKIDWPTFKEGFREAVAPRVAAEIAKASKQYGQGVQANLFKTIADKAAPVIVDTIVEKYATPAGLIALARAGGELGGVTKGLAGGFGQVLGGGGQAEGGQQPAGGGIGGAIGGLLGGGGAQAGGLAGLGGALLGGGGSPDGLIKALTDRIAPPPAPKPLAETDKGPSYGLDNIKRFSFASPTEFVLGVAKDPAANDADLTMMMGFSDFDWKLSKIVPKL